MQRLGAHRFQLGELGDGHCGIVPHVFVGSGQAQPQRGKRLPRAIVQLAGNALPLTLLRRHHLVQQFAAQRFTRLRFAVPCGVFNGDAQLAAHRFQQRHIALM